MATKTAPASTVQYSPTGPRYQVILFGVPLVRPFELPDGARDVRDSNAGRKGNEFSDHSSFVNKYLPKVSLAPPKTDLQLTPAARAIHVQILHAKTQHASALSEINTIVSNALAEAKAVYSEVSGTLDSLLTPAALAQVKTLLSQAAAVATQIASLLADFHAAVSA
jgi:hypothetical protein